MATIDSKEIIDRIIAANGKEYEDEPPVIKIVKYQNGWGNDTFGVIWEGENPFRYDIESDYVRNPITYWVRK
jgi:hypothetical protein